MEQIEQLVANIEKNKIPKHITINDTKYILVKEKEYLNMQEQIRDANEEILNNIIKKEISDEMPKDFDDVYVVAKAALENIKKPITHSDIKRTIKDIKLHYPNLFIDIDQYFQIDPMEIINRND